MDLKAHMEICSMLIQLDTPEANQAPQTGRSTRLNPIDKIFEKDGPLKRLASGIQEPPAKKQVIKKPKKKQTKKTKAEPRGKGTQLYAQDHARKYVDAINENR